MLQTPTQRRRGGTPMHAFAFTCAITAGCTGTTTPEAGNAVDAAVATAFAMAVTCPLSGNIGGGGFMLVHPAPGQGSPLVIDYREQAPAAAWPTMYTREESQHTHRAVATPGTVAGMAMAHRRFGRLRWAQLLQPAVDLARHGFAIDAYLANALNVILGEATGFAELQRVYGKPAGGLWVEGDRLQSPDLAHTMELLRDQGEQAFYAGPIAAAITAEMERGHGLITAADLAGYRAIERQPLTGRYLDRYDIHVPPPPSSGGVCLLMEIEMLRHFDRRVDERWAPRTLHLLAETMRRACRDRARYLGDPAFAPLPPELLTADYSAQQAASIDLQRATRSEAIAGDIPITSEGTNTTHFSVVDQDGMAVANTYTLERLWGSRIVVAGAGFLLNNDMRAFHLFPGITEANGTLGTAANVIAPGKRPLSSMTPTIVTENGRVVMVIGSPGSKAIPHTILCVLENVFVYGMPLTAAVEAPRLSHEWLPDRILIETPELHPETSASLTGMGHLLEKNPKPQGDAHTILVRGKNRYTGVADRRHSGKAAGY